MRNMLALLATGMLVFAGLGWYLDWYKIQSAPSGPGRTGIQIDFDRTKFTEDVSRGLQKGGQRLQEALEKADQKTEATVAAQPEKKTTDIPASIRPYSWLPAFHSNLEEQEARTPSKQR